MVEVSFIRPFVSPSVLPSAVAMTQCIHSRCCYTNHSCRDTFLAIIVIIIINIIDRSIVSMMMLLLVLVIMRHGDVLLWWIPSTTEMLDVLVVVVVGAPSQFLHAYFT